MIEEKNIELCVIRTLVGSKLLVEYYSRNTLIDNDDKNTEDKIYKMLEENMPSIDCQENPRIEIFCDYIFDDEIFVYTRSHNETLSGLMSIKYLEGFRDLISKMETSQELLTWFDALIENVCEKNGIKLDLH